MDVSVILTVKNESLHISSCINSILHQSYQDFEIIIIDDNSTDNTAEIIKSFKSEKIKYFFVDNCEGHANLRNLGVKKVKGQYIFFTDGDCKPHCDWLKTGLDILKTGIYLGVEGKTFYETDGNITSADSNTHRMNAGGYMTCNVAYTKKSIESVNFFDSKFKYVYEDRDLGLRIKKNGKIYFNENMLVFHQKKKLNITALFRRSNRIKDMIYFDVKHGRSDSEYIKYNILYFNHLMCIFFPPLLFLGSRNETFYDFFITSVKYFFFIYERIIIWIYSIKYKKFII